MIQPQFEGVANFSGGFARVLTDGKWGYIDKAGAFMIQPQFLETNDFSEGLAPVRLHDKWVYIDKAGAFVIQPQFDRAWHFHNGLAKTLPGGLNHEVRRNSCRKRCRNF